MPREFYPEEFTTRSRSVLERVAAALPTSVLIGGWATWVRTRGPTSHDIDLIVDHAGLAIIRSLTDDVSSSSHIGGQKWRATIDEIHLDLYVPFQSRLGQRLALRVEMLLDEVEEIDGWRVLTVPGHLATKVAALLDRPDTMPGEKDRSEILALLPNADARAVVQMIGTASERDLVELREDLTQALFVYLAEADEVDKTMRTDLRRTQREWDTVVDELVDDARA